VKDQVTLLRALARLVPGHPELQVDIVGEDTLSGEIQRLAQTLDLAGRVHFHGFLTQRQLHPVMQRAHVAVISSRHEAGPVALLEAAAVGVPTVGTAVGHIVEWAPDAAVAVPVRDFAALAGAIHHVLSDETLRMRLAHAARLRALREDADCTAACFEELYSELLHRGR
jgi:glycosyltransferase involved in cell wall biosynthesis